jgi:hypothetical protein
MRGSLNHQIGVLLSRIDCRRGESKSKSIVKRQFYNEVRTDKERVKSGDISPNERMKGTVSNLAERYGIYSDNMADKFRDNVRKIAEHAKTALNISQSKLDLNNLPVAVYKSYLASQFTGERIQRRTAQNICSYTYKLARAAGQGEEIKSVIKDVFEASTFKQPSKVTEYKNHINPIKVLNEMKTQAEQTGNDNAYKSYLVSRILYESGCRRSVATLISDTSMTKIDTTTGIMSYKTKAGQLGATIHGNHLSAETVRLVAE